MADTPQERRRRARESRAASASDDAAPASGGHDGGPQSPRPARAEGSGGSGGGGGIGTGGDGGIGSGTGGGLGPGSGGGTGGGAFRAGTNGIGQPVCIYCPPPEFSDEARKAKYMGFVLLDVLVTADGRVTDPIVIKGPGMGLDEKAVERVKTWKMHAAPGPGGKPTSCRVQIEVHFTLL